MRSSSRLLLAVCLILCLPRVSAARCGVWRWDVKTAKDVDRMAIKASSPITTTIEKLLKLKRPAVTITKTTPRQAPYEFNVYTIRGNLREAKWEGDQQSGDDDYHLVIEDEQGRSLVVEVPSPTCASELSALTGHRSRFVQGITKARKTIDDVVTIPKSFKKINRRVEVTGVGFFDQLSAGHQPRGSAPNQIELHPVTGLKFLPEPVPFALARPHLLIRRVEVRRFTNPRLESALERVLDDRRARGLIDP
jgi:hypothetical protein